MYSLCKTRFYASSIFKEKEKGYVMELKSQWKTVQGVFIPGGEHKGQRGTWEWYIELLSFENSQKLVWLLSAWENCVGSHMQLSK